MTRDELTIWAEQRGLSVIDNAEHQELCAKAAAGIAAKADLDRDFEALFAGRTSTDQTTGKDT